jgi:hypothetical protein
LIIVMMKYLKDIWVYYLHSILKSTSFCINCYNSTNWNWRCERIITCNGEAVWSS